MKWNRIAKQWRENLVEKLSVTCIGPSVEVMKTDFAYITGFRSNYEVSSLTLADKKNTTATTNVVDEYLQLKMKERE